MRDSCQPISQNPSYIYFTPPKLRIIPNVALYVIQPIPYIYISPIPIPPITNKKKNKKYITIFLLKILIYYIYPLPHHYI